MPDYGPIWPLPQPSQPSGPYDAFTTDYAVGVPGSVAYTQALNQFLNPVTGATSPASTFQKMNLSYPPTVIVPKYPYSAPVVAPPSVVRGPVVPSSTGTRVTPSRDWGGGPAPVQWSGGAAPRQWNPPAPTNFGRTVPSDIAGPVAPSSTSSGTRAKVPVGTASGYGAGGANAADPYTRYVPGFVRGGADPKTYQAQAIAELNKVAAPDGTKTDPFESFLAAFGMLADQQNAAAASAAAAQRAANQRYYSGMLSGLDQQTAAENAALDQRKQAIADLLGQSNTRLTDILQNLGTQTQAAGAATSQAYTDAAARQAALQQEFAASEAARAAGQAQTLGAFGVSPAGIERQFTPAQMVEAQRAALAQQQAADAALYANRGAVQAGLSSDVSTRNSQQAAILQAQLDYQRQQAALAAAQQRAQIAAQAAASGVNL